MHVSMSGDLPPGPPELCVSAQVHRVAATLQSPNLTQAAAGAIRRRDAHEAFEEEP